MRLGWGRMVVVPSPMRFQVVCAARLLDGVGAHPLPRVRALGPQGLLEDALHKSQLGAVVGVAKCVDAVYEPLVTKRSAPVISAFCRPSASRSNKVIRGLGMLALRG